MVVLSDDFVIARRDVIHCFLQIGSEIQEGERKNFYFLLQILLKDFSFVFPLYFGLFSCNKMQALFFFLQINININVFFLLPDNMRDAHFHTVKSPGTLNL